MSGAPRVNATFGMSAKSSAGSFGSSIGGGLGASGFSLVAMTAVEPAWAGAGARSGWPGMLPRTVITQRDRGLRFLWKVWRMPGAGAS